MTHPDPEATRLEAEVEAVLIKVIDQRSARLAQEAGQRLGRLVCKIVGVGANDPTIGLREGCDWVAAQTTRRMCDLGDSAGLDGDLTRELVGITIGAFWKAAAPILEPATVSPKSLMTAAEALATKRWLTPAEADEVMASMAADDAREWADTTFRSFMAALRGSAPSPADRAWMVEAAGFATLNLVRQTDRLANDIALAEEDRRALIETRAAAFAARLEELAVTVLG